MIPYVEQPIVHVFGRPIALFQVMVCLAVIVGHELVVRRASRRGFERDAASSLVAWTIFLGFVGSHLVDVIFYTPERLREDPLQLFAIWGSMSSFGGIFGGMLGGLLVAWRRGLSRAQMLQFVDVVAFVFPFAWIFGRAGCAFAHDHLGIRSDHFLAVAFPDGPRFDLGLLELLYTFAICGVFLLLDRRARPSGFYLGAFFLLYAPVRFGLDVLRTEDARYLGWTPGQYASLLGMLAGAAVLVMVLRRASAPATEPAKRSA